MVSESKVVQSREREVGRKQSAGWESIRQVFHCLDKTQRLYYIDVSEQEYSWLCEVLTQKRVEAIKHDHISQNLDSKSLATLRYGKWLNDEICNAYIHLISRSLNDDSTVIVNTFFYGLTQNNDNKLIRMSAKAKINSSTKLVLVPFNQSNVHWSLFVVDQQSKVIQYWDSRVAESESGVTPFLKHFQNLERMAKKWKNSSIEQEQEYSYEVASSPQQTNMFDCGVFMLKNIQVISRKQHHPKQVFNQETIFYDRIQIAVALKRGHL